MEWQTSKNPNSNLQQHVLSSGDTCIAVIHEEWNDHKLEYVVGSATFHSLTTAKQFAETGKKTSYCGILYRCSLGVIMNWIKSIFIKLKWKIKTTLAGYIW